MRMRTCAPVVVCVARKLRPCPSYSGRGGYYDVNKLMKLLTTLGRLDIVLFSKATGIDSAQFLMSAMKLKDKLPLLPVRVGQCDRLMGSVSRSQSYDVWVATSTHRSRSEAASVYYKMVNLRLPGEAADGLLCSLFRTGSRGKMS